MEKGLVDTTLDNKLVEKGTTEWTGGRLIPSLDDFKPSIIPLPSVLILCLKTERQ